ncbi:hypothetical protein BFR04_00060 [Gaetbulibacter sp. 4G1]|nr:hypothetical protein [Gaetbulibacter sp. 4G1]PIA79288.1 hypothetical protein BFR04_00060 [Gaetbulibacter sp. 4G1]
MFENITYKKKFFAVIIGFALLFMACYKKTYRHMFAAKKELNNVEQKLSSIDDSYNKLYALKNEIQGLDNVIGAHSIDAEDVQQELLDYISKMGIDVNIVSIEDVHLYSDDEFLVYSNQIELEGSYTNLISALYKTEKSFKNSRVISSAFYSKKNYITNKQNLFLKIILQNYEKAK